MGELQGEQACIFCRVVRGEFNTVFMAENAQAVAFRDLHPQAPTHVLVVPRRHLTGLRELDPTDVDLAGALLALVNEVARKEGLLDGGFRLLTNDGPDAGQSVEHLHFHVLGGKKLHEPLA